MLLLHCARCYLHVLPCSAEKNYLSKVENKTSRCLISNISAQNNNIGQSLPKLQLKLLEIISETDDNDLH